MTVRPFVRAAVALGFGGLAWLASPASPSPSLVAPAHARDGELQVGDQLQAVEDVSLDEATIAKGSKISISGRKTVAGRILLDVALADGHIVRAVPLSSLRQSFRRVDG